MLLPGEHGSHTKEARLTEGIALPDDTWEALRKLAADLGLNVDKADARPS